MAGCMCLKAPNGQGLLCPYFAAGRELSWVVKKAEATCAASLPTACLPASVCGAQQPMHLNSPFESAAYLWGILQTP